VQLIAQFFMEVPTSMTLNDLEIKK